MRRQKPEYVRRAKTHKVKPKGDRRRKEKVESKEGEAKGPLGGREREMESSSEDDQPRATLDEVLDALVSRTPETREEALRNLGFVKPRDAEDSEWLKAIALSAVKQASATTSRFARLTFDVLTPPRAVEMDDILTTLPKNVVFDFWAAFDASNLPIIGARAFTMREVLSPYYVASGDYNTPSVLEWKRISKLYVMDAPPIAAVQGYEELDALDADYQANKGGAIAPPSLEELAKLSVDDRPAENRKVPRAHTANSRYDFAVGLTTWNELFKQLLSGVTDDDRAALLTIANSNRRDLGS